MSLWSPRAHLLPLFALVVCVAGAGLAGAQAGLEAPGLLEEHGPIRIDGDRDFDAAHGVRGGSGTAEDPYRISGWRIREPGVHVRVANTTKAFELRNLDLQGLCTAAPDGGACALEAGIHVENASGFRLVHNAITGMERAGISLVRVRGAEVVANLVQGGGGVVTGAGVLVHASQDVEVRGDVVLGVGPSGGNLASAGLRVWESRRVLVADTMVANATEACVNVLTSDDVVLEDDDLAGCTIGLTAQSEHVVVRFTNLTGHLQNAVVADRGSVVVEHSLVQGNLRGVAATNAARLTLRANSIAGHVEHALAVFDNATADARGDWWGHASGPDVNGTGPGSGERIAVVRASLDQLQWDPWLHAPPVDAGAHAPRAGGLGVSASPSGTSGPVAVLEGPTLGRPGQELRFSAARSSDPTGGGLRHAWELGDGTTAQGARVTHTYAAVGTYLVQLTVTDALGTPARAALRVGIEREPLGVVLHVNASVERGAPLRVSAEATGQPLGPVVFRFTAAGPASFQGEPSPSNRTTLRLDAPGEAFVGVEATAGGEVATAFERVRVRNHAPLAAIVVEPGAGDTRTTFRFRAEASDVDGDVLTYRWDTGSGHRGLGPEFQVRFDRAGTQLIELVVSDGFDAVQAQVTVLVTEAPRQPTAPVPTQAFPLAALAAMLAARALRPRRWA